MSKRSSRSVHIRVSDSGWILERLAREICDRLPYVKYDLYPDSSAEIQYYMTYGCWQQRVSPIEMALFTHKEEVPSAAAKFDNVAGNMDFCIAQSEPTKRILSQCGVSDAVIISPGVDLARFKPTVKIGVVGRTYHTGRKGESLVSAVMDIPGIEWHFTGTGWPGPARFVTDEEMPAFYRSLDYVLVPSLIEGGPMCVLEALASGCKVIGSDVGWVSQFPHIRFKKGSETDLRRVLLEVVEEKAKLHRSVAEYSWEAWAEHHHKVFTHLLGRDPMLEFSLDSRQNRQAASQTEPTFKAAVAVHGSEMSDALGGPSVRAPRTAAALSRLGISASFVAGNKFTATDYDVVHVMNVWHPDQCEVLLRQVEKNDRPSVLSPIFLDLSERKFFNKELLEILTSSADDTQLVSLLSDFKKEVDLARDPKFPKTEHASGYFSTVRRLSTYASHLILLSEHERDQLLKIGVAHPSVSIVKNPVESAVFNDADGKLFSEKYGVSDYVLCVGRIESRKNQALLAFALRNTDIPLVFIGHESDAKYASLVRKWAAPNVTFIGRIEPNSAMLASALAGARVFCLPSWSEGAPLVALEAAAAGCNMVLSNRSSEQEYFGDLARYADPADHQDLHDKVLAAYGEQWSSEKSDKLKELVRQGNDWDTYARNTLAAYRLATDLHKSRRAKLVSTKVGARRVFVDLTTTAHHAGPPTGIARVEARLAEEILKFQNFDIQYIVWNSSFRKFLRVDIAELRSGQLGILRSEFATSLLSAPDDATAFSEVDFSAGDIYINFGGAWIRNSVYLADIWAIKCARGVVLISTIYDVIQYRQQSMFPPGIGLEFTDNCKRLAEISDLILTCSEQSARDIREFCSDTGISAAPISTFRLGDELMPLVSSVAVQSDLISGLTEGSKFVLYVSSVDVRKNHRMMIELWRSIIAEHGNETPTLVFVGRKGWHGEDSLALLDADPLLRRKIFHLEGVNDATLEWLYGACMFTVFPSLYEGWGLPVAESLNRGKFCIASNAGSLSEVAPGFAEYISPLDFVAWYTALKKYCFTPALLEAKNELVKQYRPTPWSQTASSVAQAIEAIVPIDRLAPFSPELPLSLCAETESARQLRPTRDYLLGGWGKPEKNGTWTIGTRAVLGFQFDKLPENPVTFRMNGSAFGGLADNLHVVVLANGSPVANWSVGGHQQLFFARIQPALFLGTAGLRIEFVIRNPRSPAGLGESTDARLLGLRVHSVQFQHASEVLNLSLNCWHQQNDPSVTEWSVHCGDMGLGTRYMAFDSAADGPTLMVPTVNDRPRAGFSLRENTAGPRAMQFVAAEVDSGGSGTFGLAVSPVPQRSLKIFRLGIFESPPPEAVRLAMARHAGSPHQISAGMGSGHVPHWGNAPRVELDSTVSLGSGGLAAQCLVGGWYEPQPEGAWASGNPASIHLRPSGPFGSRLALRVEYACYAPLRHARVEFKLSVGSAAPLSLAPTEEETSSTSGSSQEFEVLTEDAIDSDGVLMLTLHAEGAIAPKDIGESIDPRPLSVFMRALSLSTRNEFIDLDWSAPLFVRNALGPDIRAFAGGWHPMEDDGCWSSGRASSIALRLPQDASEEFILDLELLAFVADAGAQASQVDVYVGSTHLGSLTVSGNAQERHTLLAPFHQGRPDPRNVLLRLESKSVGIPRTLGASSDTRSLAFKLSCITARRKIDHPRDGLPPQEAESPRPSPIEPSVLLSH